MLPFLLAYQGGFLLFPHVVSGNPALLGPLTGKKVDYLLLSVFVPFSSA